MMRPILLCSFLLLGAMAAALGMPDSSRPSVPVVPKGVIEAERAALTQASLLLSKEQFDQATAWMKSLLPPTSVPVYTNLTGVPRANRPSYRQAVQDAINAWNAGLAGAAQFKIAEQEENTSLCILFEKSVAQVRSGQAQLLCIESLLDTPPTGADGLPTPRTGQARIALNVPYTEELHSQSSVTHLAGQALGAYLGLGPSENPADVMGPDTHDKDVAQKPSTADLERARALQEIRLQLLGYAEKRVAVHLPRAVMVLDSEAKDAGDVARGDDAHFRFQVQNTGDAPLELEPKACCGTQVGDYDKVIPPGGQGKVEITTHTKNYRGRVLKLVDLKSNDPEKPVTALRLSLNVLSAIQVLPADSITLPMKADGPTTKELEIRLNGKEPPEITRVSCGVAYATAKVEPLPAPAEGGRSYKLTVTMLPQAPLGRSVFMVTAYTTSTREPTANITVLCENGILAVPVSVSMGNIRPDTPLPVTQIVTLSKGEGTFHIRRVESDDPHLEVKQEAVKDGTQYRLTVRYKGGWPAGTVRSKITVETDDARQPKFEIPVLANVVAAAQ